MFITRKENFKERRTAMKGKGKWAVLAFALGLFLAGCGGGGGGGGGSSDESAVAAKDNAVLGTWLVNVDPLNNAVSIEPMSLTLGATPNTGLGDTALTEQYSWTNQIVVTDLTTLASTTVIGFNLDGTTLAWKDVLHGTTAPNKKMVVGSEIVYRCTTAPCRNSGPGVGVGVVKYARGTDYDMNYFTMNNDTVAGRSAKIRRTATSTIPSGAGTTVRIKFGYGSASESGYTGGVFTTKIAVENHLNATIEKLRSWTGNISGDGAEDSPQLGNASDGATGRSDYPLLGGDTSPTNYAKPSTTPQPIAGWVAGVCYTSWGKWTTAAKNNEGCTKLKDPYDSHPYSPNNMDPVCGRITETYKFAGTPDKYKFYMQLSGNVFDWSSGIKPQDSRWDNTNYSTQYSAMAYLVPSSGDTTWCSQAGAARYWWLGSLAPFKYGSSKRCGTLITNPNLPPRTYFALNMGLEYADTIEDQAKAFWDDYLANGGTPGKTMSVGSPFFWETSFMLIYDPAVLQAWTATSGTARTGHSNSTTFPLGFQDLNDKATYGMNMSVSPKNNPSGGKWDYSNYYPGAGNGMAYIASAQSPNVWVLTFFPGPMTYTTSTRPMKHYTSSTTTVNVSYSVPAGDTVYHQHLNPHPDQSQTAPYITQVTKCKPAAGMPKWAGQWGVAHYNSTCQLVSEGVDADVDFWSGMQVFKVRHTAKAGSWTSFRFDTSNWNFMNYHYNNKVAKTNDPNYCVSIASGKVNCGGLTDPPAQGYSIWVNSEMVNPSLPPGQTTGRSSWHVGCPYGDGVRTCGGYQYVQSVVCVR